MDPPLVTPVVGAAVAALLAVAAAVAALVYRQRERRRDLRRAITLLRASDPHTRIQALERTQPMPPGRRSALGRLLRRELGSASRGGHASQHVVTIWFIRQILALLTDSRQPVRADAARVLGAVLGRGASQLATEAGEPISLAPAVAAAVELAGGRVLTAGEDARSETRVLALAEMLEAGLRPLAVGLRALEGVEEEALEPLTSALRDRNPRVRRTLVEVLTTMGGERAVGMLLPLLHDPSPELRAQAARALGELKADSSADDLQPLLQDPIGDVRAAAAGALAETGALQACTSVLNALAEEARREDRSEAARRAMIEAVAALSDGGLPSLAQALADLPRPASRELAACLERNGIIERWLTEGMWAGREELLASLLSGIAEVGVARPLLDALDSTDESIRRHSVAALGHSHDPQATGAVAALLSDPDVAVRTEAVEALTRQAEAAALGPLAAAAADPEYGVRLAAVVGIGSVVSGRERWERERLPADFDIDAAMGECQRALLSAAQEPKSALRAEAARALALYATPEAADVLVAMAVGDADDDVRSTAGSAFEKSGFAHKRRLLAPALGDRDETRRARALTVLSRSGGPEVARQIVEALDDPSEAVRKAALEAMVHIDPAAVTDALLPLLKNPDPRVRAAAAEQLGKGPPGDVVEALVQSLSDPEEEVRVSALRAVAGMGRAVRPHQGTITARRSDPSPRVREAAAAALNQLRDAWAEAEDTAEAIRHGPLSPAGAMTLIEMGVTGDMGALLRALAGERSSQTVVRCLIGEARDKLPHVLRALHSTPDQEQTRAALSLAGAIRHGADPNALLTELKSLDSEVRLMAVEVVGRVSAPTATEALIEVLQRDPLADVRSRAASLLADSPSSAARAALQRAHRDDPNNVVRRVAGRALDRGAAASSETSILMSPDEPTSQADAAST